MNREEIELFRMIGGFMREYDDFKGFKKNECKLQSIHITLLK